MFMKRVINIKAMCVIALIMLIGNVAVYAQDYIALNTNSCVRTRPTVKSPAVEGQWGVMVFSKGEVMRVLGESGEWYHIVISGYGNTKGYVMKKFCTTDFGKLPDVLPEAEGEHAVSVTKDNGGSYWLKYTCDNDRQPVKGVWQGNMLVFSYTMKQMYGKDYMGDDYMDVAASYAVIDGKVYAKEYTRTD